MYPGALCKIRFRILFPTIFSRLPDQICWHNTTDRLCSLLKKNLEDIHLLFCKFCHFATEQIINYNNNTLQWHYFWDSDKSFKQKNAQKLKYNKLRQMFYMCFISWCSVCLRSWLSLRTLAIVDCYLLILESCTLNHPSIRISNNIHHHQFSSISTTLIHNYPSFSMFIHVYVRIRCCYNFWRSVINILIKKKLKKFKLVM